MKDIADDLNVSVVTVSKVLRNQGDISTETRERVLKRAKELNYQPNWVARSLVTRKTYLVGLVVPDLMHSFFAEIAKAVAAKLRTSGYRVVIANSEEDAEVESGEIESLLARRVDGLILASAQHPSKTRIFRSIEESNTPFVLIDRTFRGVKASYVGVDHEEIGRMATEHLIAQGCRRLAHLRGPENAPGIGRMRGFQAALEAHGLHLDGNSIVSGAFSYSSGYEAMQQLLRGAFQPDGIVCYNDPVAAGALKAILEAGLEIPRDVAVIGAGNVHYSDLLRVPLTTVDQNTPEIGERAAEVLLEQLGSNKPVKPRTVVVTPHVVVRDSSSRTADPRDS
jgi:LacI family transcriptional regulator